MCVYQRRPARGLWRMPRSSFGVFDLFSDAPADSSPDVLDVTPGVDPSLTQPEHGPYLVGGIFYHEECDSQWS